MSQKTLNLNDVINYVSQLPFIDFNKVVCQYANRQKIDISNTMNFVVVSNFEERLAKLGVNSLCPQCGSTSISKYGKRNNIQVFKCKDCSKRFTRFSGTVLEKTRWHWDIWLKVLKMTLNGYSIEDMRNVLINDYSCVGIDIKTVWLWRLKLITAMANIPMPILSGIMQVDETFVRESQKGSRHLRSMVAQTEERKPRYGRQSSKFGVMGSEFATVVTAIDNRGYCVCKVASLGKLSTNIFYELFHEHIDNPAFLCSDANNIYEEYCRATNTPHYVKPSNFLKVIGNHGYIIQATDESEKKVNKKILEHLYYEGITDRITNRGEILFDKFNDIKYQNGLSLARVNELHNDIKRFINRDMTNVSTKYLQDYIGYFTYIRNWRVKHGHYPTSKADAEAIFTDILKTKKNLTSTEVRQKELVLPKPSPRYMGVLKRAN